MEASHKETAHLRLRDAISIIVGIIIGVGIFETPTKVFAQAPGPLEALWTWVLGAGLVLIGALCFAELGSAYPHSGGEYVYLTRAFGSLVGYLFAWAQLAVIRPASIGAMAFIFANQLPANAPRVPIAAAVVLWLTLINVWGMTLGKATQNALTVVKVLGLAAIVVFGLFLTWKTDPILTVVAPEQSYWFPSAMILVLWTYAGWHEAAYIAAEVKDAERNLPLSLILGTLGVAVIYLAINGVMLLALGFHDAGRYRPQEVVEMVLGPSGKTAMHVLIMISSLGAINGMIFTTARIYTAFGRDHRLFSPLSHWSRRLHTPARALIVQGLITAAFIAGVGFLGHGMTGLEYLIDVSAAVFWFFFFLAGAALFVLRGKDPDQPRPFRVPGYPWLPAVFCLWCFYMFAASVLYVGEESLVGLGIVLAGLPFYFVPKKRRTPKTAELVSHVHSE